MKDIRQLLKEYEGIEEYQDPIDFYNDENLEALEENDEISPIEQGFMVGYLEA
ncbi:hypothetical protein ACFL0W_00700 [Nanoarchaeota archaeon]